VDDSAANVSRTRKSVGEKKKRRREEQSRQAEDGRREERVRIIARETILLARTHSRISPIVRESLAVLLSLSLSLSVSLSLSLSLSLSSFARAPGPFCRNENNTASDHSRVLRALDVTSDLCVVSLCVLAGAREIVATFDDADDEPCRRHRACRRLQAGQAVLRQQEHHDLAGHREHAEE